MVENAKNAKTPHARATNLGKTPLTKPRMHLPQNPHRFNEHLSLVMRLNISKSSQDEQIGMSLMIRDSASPH